MSSLLALLPEEIIGDILNFAITPSSEGSSQILSTCRAFLSIGTRFFYREVVLRSWTAVYLFNDNWESQAQGVSWSLEDMRWVEKFVILMRASTKDEGFIENRRLTIGLNSSTFPILKHLELCAEFVDNQLLVPYTDRPAIIEAFFHNIAPETLYLSSDDTGTLSIWDLFEIPGLFSRVKTLRCDADDVVSPLVDLIHAGSAFLPLNSLQLTVMEIVVSIPGTYSIQNFSIFTLQDILDIATSDQALLLPSLTQFTVIGDSEDQAEVEQYVIDQEKNLKVKIMFRHEREVFEHL